MDSACGGGWWRDEFMQAADNREAVQRIAEGYAERVGAVVRAHSWMLPVRNRAHHQPAYHLVLFSRHKDGLWLFGEAISLAQSRWRREILPPRTEETLFDSADMFEEDEKQREREWIATIKSNIERLLRTHGAFLIDRYHAEVMGDVLGEARQKHIKAAVKQLHRESKTGCNGVGDVPSLRITPP